MGPPRANASADNNASALPPRSEPEGVSVVGYLVLTPTGGGYIASEPPIDAAMISASVDESATDGCFLESHETAPEPISQGAAHV